MNCFLAPRIIRVILIVLLKGRIMSLPRIYMKSNATDTNIFYCHCRECKLGLRTFFEHISQSKSLSSGIKILHMMDSFEKESLGCSEKQEDRLQRTLSDRFDKYHPLAFSQDYSDYAFKHRDRSFRVSIKVERMTDTKNLQKKRSHEAQARMLMPMI